MQHPDDADQGAPGRRTLDLTSQCAMCGDELPGGSVSSCGRTEPMGLLWFSREEPFMPGIDLDKERPCPCETRKVARIR